MTGDQIMREALLLLNYTNASGEIDARQSTEIMKRGLTIVNIILADVLRVEGKKIVLLQQLTDALPVEDETAYDVIPYGVAMLIAQGENDGDNQQLMAALYNQKRASVPHAVGRVSDVIPSPIF